MEAVGGSAASGIVLGLHRHWVKVPSVFHLVGRDMSSG
jgi:hypothetical protein